MSLQWQLAAGFLYTEMVLVVIFLLPFVSPSRWQSIFKSSIGVLIASYHSIYFKVVLVIFAILFGDALREIFKYSSLNEAAHKTPSSPGAEDHIHMELFRAQRNLYISGFSLFLWLVLNRLISLISRQAKLIAESEASLKQARSATETANMLMSDQPKKDSSGSSKSLDDERNHANLVKELADGKELLEKTKKELEKATLDLETLKKQSAHNNEQYDSLMREHEKLQKHIEELENSGESKKSN